ncbi:GAF and ANTAR domain-containing protein [Actinomycetospora straminea]|uniref:GAF domain-containing protein n=1 Tax=Actinomycetospora straminea TaxID=663607 RepID=A0ABP9EYE0_9PSEU|nr:GAF and ANTAR domain-containing protein [Actinomycetospora straminea]MDD7935472.1 GAF and ANTAR domain-containing protein [Actinomycetospora straminea]
MVNQVQLMQTLAAAVDAGGPAAPLAICRSAAEWLPMGGVAIAMMSAQDGAQEPVCATDTTAARIDDLQFTLGEGPCLESFTSGRAVLVDDIADPSEARWPIFTAAAAETGARGMFVFPLHLGAARIGVLDCYRDTPGGLDDREIIGALHAADAAVWVLLDRIGQRTISAEPSTGGTSGRDWFDGSALTRAEVHQATGMLLAQFGSTATEALARLRGAAFASGRPIGEVAKDVLARRLRLSPDGTWRSEPPHDPPLT